MATVESKTSIKIDDLINDTVISGYISIDGNLILITRGGAEILAGAIGTGGGGIVETIVAGLHVTVDATDPANPIVTAVGFLETETLPASIIDAKGDLIVGSAPDTAIRKAVGTNGQALLADSTASGGVRWGAVANDIFKRDWVLVTDAGGPTDLTLSYLPRTDSLHFYWDGDEQREGVDWTRVGLVVTFVETHQQIGDYLEARYAYDANVTGWDDVVITSPSAGETIVDSTPAFTGTATSGVPVELFVDSISVGSTTADSGGNWSITSSLLADGAHTAVARQTLPDTTTADSAPVNFSVNFNFANYMSGMGWELWPRFGETTGQAIDASGNGHTSDSIGGIVSRPVTGLVSGDTNTAYDFISTSPRVTWGDAAWQDSATVASGFALFKTTNADGNGICLMSRWTFGQSTLWKLSVNRATVGNVALNLGGTEVATTGLSLNDGNKHCVLWTYDGTDVLIYVDGTLRKTQAVSATLSGTSAIHVGTDAGGGGGSFLHGFVGVIDEPAYGKFVATPDQALNLAAMAGVI